MDPEIQQVRFATHLFITYWHFNFTWLGHIDRDGDKMQLGGMLIIVRNIGLMVDTMTAAYGVTNFTVGSLIGA